MYVDVLNVQLPLSEVGIYISKYTITSIARGLTHVHSPFILGIIIHLRGVNLYGLRVSLTDFCDLHGLTGIQCNPYGYL